MTIVFKSGSLNLLELSGPVQACNGIAFYHGLCHYVQWQLITPGVYKATQASVSQCDTIPHQSFEHTHTHTYHQEHWLQREKSHTSIIWNHARQAVNVWRNTGEQSCNHSCSVQAINVTYSECVFVALGTQAALYCHLWPVWVYNISPHYLTNCTIKKKVIEHKMWFNFLYKFCLKHLPF